MNPYFWREKTLGEMSLEEWEALCDGCGRCCLHKIEDEDTQKLFYSRVACKLLDIKRCRCTRYAERQSLVPDCMSLREGFAQFQWLPSTCAYRLLAQGEELPRWHPLRTGDAESVHKAGISVRSFALSENEVADPYAHIVEWLK